MSEPIWLDVAALSNEDLCAVGDAMIGHLWPGESYFKAVPPMVFTKLRTVLTALASEQPPQAPARGEAPAATCPTCGAPAVLLGVHEPTEEHPFEEPEFRFVAQPEARPTEPSEAAIEAARAASGHTAELGMDDVLLPRRAMIAALRAAYAAQFGAPPQPPETT